MILSEYNDALYNSLTDKFIIFTAGYKGGIGKSIISLGLAKELNIPYITNDKGSAISGEIPFYEYTYFTYDFKIDEKFKNSKAVIIDLAGCFIMDKIIFKLIEKANLIILPTGENPYLDFTGSLFTSNNLYEINKNLLFIVSNISQLEMPTILESFNEIKNNYEFLKDIKVLPLEKNNSIINESLSKKISYTQSFNNLNIDGKLSKNFINNWKDITNEIVSRIKSSDF